MSFFNVPSRNFTFLSFRRTPESASIFNVVILSAAKNPRICFLLTVALILMLPCSMGAQNLPAGTRPPDSEVTNTPLAEAESAIAAQDFAHAKVLLLDITASDPKNARALYDLGYVNEAQHDPSAAEAQYRAAIAADPKSFEATAALGFLLLPRNAAQAHQELLAATALTPAVNASGAKAELLRQLASMDIATNPAAARDEVLAAIQLTSETPSDTLLTAQIADKLGDLADAEATYRRALAAAPNDPDTAYALAGLRIREDKMPDAEAVLTPAFKAHPDNAPLTAQIARVYSLEGADDKALPLLEAQHTKHPQDVATTRMLANAYNRTGNAPQADTLYQQLLATTPDDIALLTARGDSLIRQKKFAEAQALLQKADTLFLARPAILPATDDRLQLFGDLAFAASSNGQPTLVLNALDQRLQYAPEIPATLFLRATANDHLHHIATARALYTQFLAAAQGKYPDEEWEAKHRLIALAHEK